MTYPHGQALGKRGQGSLEGAGPQVEDHALQDLRHDELAKTWATKIEAEVDGYRASGKFSAGKVFIGDLIQRYTAEISGNILKTR